MPLFVVAGGHSADSASSGVPSTCPSDTEDFNNSVDDPSLTILNTPAKVDISQDTDTHTSGRDTDETGRDSVNPDDSDISDDKESISDFNDDVKHVQISTHTSENGLANAGFKQSILDKQDTVDTSIPCVSKEAGNIEPTVIDSDAESSHDSGKGDTLDRCTSCDPNEDDIKTLVTDSEPEAKLINTKTDDPISGRHIYQNDSTSSGSSDTVPRESVGELQTDDSDNSSESTDDVKTESSTCDDISETSEDNKEPCLSDDISKSHNIDVEPCVLKEASGGPDLGLTESVSKDIETEDNTLTTEGNPIAITISTSEDNRELTYNQIPDIQIVDESLILQQPPYDFGTSMYQDNEQIAKQHIQNSYIFQQTEKVTVVKGIDNNIEEKDIIKEDISSDYAGIAFANPYFQEDRETTKTMGDTHIPKNMEMFEENNHDNIEESVIVREVVTKVVTNTDIKTNDWIKIEGGKNTDSATQNNEDSYVGFKTHINNDVKDIQENGDELTEAEKHLSKQETVELNDQEEEQETVEDAVVIDDSGQSKRLSGGYSIDKCEELPREMNSEHVNENSMADQNGSPNEDSEAIISDNCLADNNSGVIATWDNTQSALTNVMPENLSGRRSSPTIVITDCSDNDNNDDTLDSAMDNSHDIINGIHEQDRDVKNDSGVCGSIISDAEVDLNNTNKDISITSDKDSKDSRPRTPEISVVDYSEVPSEECSNKPEANNTQVQEDVQGLRETDPEAPFIPLFDKTISYGTLTRKCLDKCSVYRNKDYSNGKCIIIAVISVFIICGLMHLAQCH